MVEALSISGNWPGSSAWEAKAIGHDEPTDGAGVTAGDEEWDPEGEEAPPAADWTAYPGHEMDSGDLEDEPATTAAVDEEPPFEDDVAGSTGEPAGPMWAATPDTVPFFEHALYVEAMHALAAGKGPVVAANLAELAELYPDEPAIRDLLVRMELRSAVAQERRIPADHRRAAPLLQSALTLLLLVTVGLAGIAGFYVAYQRLVSPIAESNRLAAEIRALEVEIDRRLEAGDWNGAREKLEELARRQPGNAEIAGQLAYADRQKELSDWYADAVAAEQAGDVERALVLLQQIEAQEPAYRDVVVRTRNLQTEQALERDWLEAERRVQAEDWEGATALLLDVRRRDPEFRQEQVKDRLFQIYERLARQSLSQANGSPERLRQALVYLNGALAERPGNRDLVRQRTLALRYVRGADAEARGDWLEAAEQWEAINVQEPGYQGGVLQARLKEAYPGAARQAIAEAGGSIELLEQAAVYLDRARADAPDDEGLRQERELVAAYLEGAEAFEAGFWTQAIRRWGPLYAVQPGYQNGALETFLKQACGASTEPDLALCPP